MSALDLVAGNLAGVRNKTVHKLLVAHLKREYSHRIILHGDIQSHRQHEGSLTHSRAGGDDNEVGVLPARGKFVEPHKTCAQTADTCRPLCRYLHKVDGAGEQGVDLRYISLEVAL